MSGMVTKRPVVLVVEDEIFLRMNAVDMIEDAGSEVVEAATADEAIGILETRTDVKVVSPTSRCPARWTV